MTDSKIQDAIPYEPNSSDPIGAPPSSRVLVTGGTSYLAAHIIKLLLLENKIVRTTVRNLKFEPKYNHLFSLVPEKKANLEIFEADLLGGGWLEATSNCDAVIHVASPFPTKNPKTKT